MFLKKEPFTLSENIILTELSALQRIEYLEYLTDIEKALSPEDQNTTVITSALVALNIKASARLVSLSLFHEDASKDIDVIHNKVMSEWSFDVICIAALQIRKLSGMMPVEVAPDEPAEGTEDAPEPAEYVSAEKS